MLTNRASDLQKPVAIITKMLFQKTELTGNQLTQVHMKWLPQCWVCANIDAMLAGTSL